MQRPTVSQTSLNLNEVTIAAFLYQIHPHVLKASNYSVNILQTFLHAYQAAEKTPDYDQLIAFCQLIIDFLPSIQTVSQFILFNHQCDEVFNGNTFHFNVML